MFTFKKGLGIVIFTILLWQFSCNFLTLISLAATLLPSNVNSVHSYVNHYFGNITFFFITAKRTMFQLKLIIFGLTIVGGVVLAVYNHYNEQEQARQYRAYSQRPRRRLSPPSRIRSPSPPLSITSDNSSG